MELLIVMSIMIILMLIAIPNFISMKAQADETSAIQSLRAIYQAQIQYQTNFPANGFACALTALGGNASSGPPSPQAAQVLQGDLATGQKSGYTFNIVNCTKVTVNNQDMYTSYEATAVPQSIGKSGHRGFCIDSGRGDQGRPCGRHQLLPADSVSARACCCWLLCLFPRTAWCADTAQQLAQRVDKYYNGLHSLRTAFTESFHGMGIDREESGTLLLRKPGKMHWSYTNPRGKGLSARRQVRLVLFPRRCPGRASVRGATGRSAFAAALSPRTHATAEGTRRVDPLHHRPTGCNFPECPRACENRVAKIVLGVSADGVIHSMSITETDGAETAFTFKDSQADAPAPDADFVFHPPPGIPVVDGLPPV